MNTDIVAAMTFTSNGSQGFHSGKRQHPARQFLINQPETAVLAASVSLLQRPRTPSNSATSLQPDRAHPVDCARRCPERRPSVVVTRSLLGVVGAEAAPGSVLRHPLLRPRCAPRKPTCSARATCTCRGRAGTGSSWHRTGCLGTSRTCPRHVPPQDPPARHPRPRPPRPQQSPQIQESRRLPRPQAWRARRHQRRQENPVPPAQPMDDDLTQGHFAFGPAAERLLKLARQWQTENFRV